MKLQTGESFTLKRSLLAMASTRIVYAGMVHTDTFSIAVTKADGYRAIAYNLYFHKDQDQLKIEGIPLRIMCVSHAELWFQLDA